MRSEDAEAFDELMREVCAAYNRPLTDDTRRAYWKALRAVSLPDLQRRAQEWIKTQRKWPTPSDLTPPRKPVVQRRAPEPQMSIWMQNANRMLFTLAYRDPRRGFKPMGPELLQRCLGAKADYVRMAEEAEAAGEPLPGEEFMAMCREGFERLLGTQT